MNFVIMDQSVALNALLALYQLQVSKISVDYQIETKLSVVLPCLL